jgi:hypothetical protein
MVSVIAYLLQSRWESKIGPEAAGAGRSPDGGDHTGAALTMDSGLIILKPMSMTKRLQIPVSDQESSQFQAAARRAGLPLAEWARRQLREKADEALGGAALGPREALALLKSLEAPVAPVETMIEESISGRYS